ncbi:MAG: hypothetical protein WBQ18_02165 [Solirubrobacteraceae bacterium]
MSTSTAARRGHRLARRQRDPRLSGAVLGVLDGDEVLSGHGQEVAAGVDQEGRITAAIAQSRANPGGNPPLADTAEVKRRSRRDPGDAGGTVSPIVARTASGVAVTGANGACSAMLRA